MDKTRLLIVVLADLCRSLILESDPPNLRLPNALQPTHLLWMCDQIEEHADVGPASKLHRWIGFIQGAMLANQMLELDELVAIFNEVKSNYGQTTDGMGDLIDHLGPTDSFEFDIGGQVWPSTAEQKR